MGERTELCTVGFRTKFRTLEVSTPHLSPDVYIIHWNSLYSMRCAKNSHSHKYLLKRKDQGGVPKKKEKERVGALVAL